MSSPQRQEALGSGCPTVGEAQFDRVVKLEAARSLYCKIAFSLPNVQVIKGKTLRSCDYLMVLPHKDDSCLNKMHWWLQMVGFFYSFFLQLLVAISPFSLLSFLNYHSGHIGCFLFVCLFNNLKSKSVIVGNHCYWTIACIHQCA